MVDQIPIAEQDKLFTELLLRISTIEKLLIDKNIISLEEYNNIFTKSVNKLIDVMKNDIKLTESEVKSTEITPPGILKH